MECCKQLSEHKCNTVTMFQSKTIQIGDPPMMTFGLKGCTAVAVIRGKTARLYHCDPALFTLENVKVKAGDVITVKTPSKFVKRDDGKWDSVSNATADAYIKKWRLIAKSVNIVLYSTVFGGSSKPNTRQMVVYSGPDGFKVKAY